MKSHIFTLVAQCFRCMYVALIKTHFVHLLYRRNRSQGYDVSQISASNLVHPAMCFLSFTSLLGMTSAIVCKLGPFLFI